MRHVWSERVKQAVRPALFKTLWRGKTCYTCSVCGYEGPFKDKVVSRVPDVRREHSKCLGCGATERHRMLSLVIDEVLGDWDARQKSLLHIAPDPCLQPRLRELFGTYHTADLLAPGVDFKEDIQSLSFPDASYDCVFISRVLTIPPDLEASLREVRRVLKPGGMAVIAETYTHARTVEFGTMRAGRSREIGVDALARYERHFARVERFRGDRYDGRYQLNNRMRLDGARTDAYPALVRVPGIGFMDLVAICHA